ncbi:MAG: HAD hydrolase family protein, partial [Bdellovibrionota bacterium]
TESVFCNRSDGWWIQEIKKLGIEQVILSTEKNPVVKARGDKVGLPVIQGQSNKLAALESLLSERNISASGVVYVGNDMNDFACLQKAGHPMAPQDSHPEVLKISRVLPCNGGAGIVRHVHDWLKSL